MGRPKQNFDINIPTSWNEVTLEKFLKVKELYKDGNQPTYIELVSALSDKDVEYIKQIPSLLFQKLAEKLQYLGKEFKVEPSNKIEINGDTYIINVEDELKTGEFVDVQMVR